MVIYILANLYLDRIHSVSPVHQLGFQLLPSSCVPPHLLHDDLVPLPGHQAAALDLLRREKEEAVHHKLLPSHVQQHQLVQNSANLHLK